MDKPRRKKYQCDYCSKDFTRPSALQTHVYTHTGEKPHECDISGCGRRFAVISNLRRHLRVHRPSHVRRRLSSQERREYVERLIERTGSLTEGHLNYNSFPSMCYSSASSISSGASSPRTPSPTTDNFRILMPKIQPKPRSIFSRPVCLTVKHLLNDD
ncbi:hypothetical protein K501DRAFT_215557 [Backusella circina FSU 941]|nr:hypothetical protein K501DRAFT_215557 [Backusella circina FSU 941]